MEISSFHQFPDESLNELVQLNIFLDGLRPQSKQLLDAFAGEKIKMKTLEEAMELIENMAANDHAILHDRAYTPTKRSLLELTAQDATLAQNNLSVAPILSATTLLFRPLFSTPPSSCPY